MIMAITGNVVDPLSVIEGGGNQKENPAYGADTLRLWVSGKYGARNLHTTRHLFR